MEMQLLPLPESGFKSKRLADDSFGIEVHGFDLAKLAHCFHTSTATTTTHGSTEQHYVSLIEDLLLRHGFVVFRNQNLSEEQEVDVARSFRRYDEVFRPPKIEVLGNTHRDGSWMKKEEITVPGQLESANPRNRGKGKTRNKDLQRNRIIIIAIEISSYLLLLLLLLLI